MEKYRLVFNGERCGDYAKLPIEHHIKLLKISQKAQDTILLGKRVVIKSGVPSKRLQNEKAALEKMGLVTEQRLQLNASIFAVGLRDVDTSLGDIDLTLPVYELDKLLKPPTLVGRPFDDVLQTTDSGDTVAVETSNYQLNGFLLIAMAAFLALTMQTYVVVFVKAIGLPNIIATVAGIAFLLGCVLILPRLFQPLQKSRVQLRNSAIDVYEQVELVLGKKRSVWETSEALGEFSINGGSAEASFVDSIYHWSALHSIEDTSQKAVNDIQGSIIDGAMIEVTQTIFQKLKPILNRMTSRGNGKANVNWELLPASVVSNDQGEIVALMYQGTETGYRIVRKELCEDAVLHAFCLSIHAAGLV